MIRRARLLAPVLAAALLLTGCTEQGAQAPDLGSVDHTVDQWQHPTTAPVTFSGTTVDGSTFSSKQYLGKVLVVNFWYAGCPPCRAEAPTLDALATRYAGKAQFVGVNVSDDSATAASFERTYKTDYPSIVDQEGGASVQLAFAASKPPKAVPSTLVLDGKGRVTARIVGLANKSVLNQLIQDAVDGTAA
ncbi:TlpA family protein disulfide reductase [Amnibacterium sp.]|uniref:TlpA family protein disulfide reductase n=1 Tax=Amnibacterium sp. TaxID=1872496 RepID=UPI003F7BAC35